MQTGFDETVPVNEEIIPLEYKVLVRVDVVDDKSSGGMWLSEETRDRMQYQTDRGVIVRMAGNAFADKGVFAERPEVGDRVMFDKFSGSLLRNTNERGITMRLLNDKDVCAILKEAE